jgi:hypothetical protein
MDPTQNTGVPTVDPIAGVPTPPTPVVTPPVEQPVATPTPEPQEAPVEQPVVPPVATPAEGCLQAILQQPYNRLKIKVERVLILVRILSSC